MTDIFDKIKKEITENKVVLFMKGNNRFPSCGFSAMVVNILKKMDVEFKDINVLEDLEIRDGIKKFSDWPTIPQLYVNGEFIGGCDIVQALYADGELKEILDKVKESNDL